MCNLRPSQLSHGVKVLQARMGMVPALSDLSCVSHNDPNSINGGRESEAMDFRT